MVRVGIYVKHGFMIDGATQQGIFLYECFESAKIDCSLVVDTTKLENHEPFRKIHVPAQVSTVSDIEPIFQLDVLLCVSLFLTQEDLLRALKENGVRLVLYNCGNRFITYQEAIVGVSPIGTNFIEDLSPIGKYYSEVWTIPNYTDDSGFYRCLFGKDITFRGVPYVWSPSRMPLVPPYEHFEGDTSYVIIMEWNKQVTKTCLIPLLACDRLYRQGKHKVRVWLFCKPETEGFRRLLNTLAVEVNCYPPYRYPEVMIQLRQKKLNGFLFSHQIHNALNFLHMETFHFGCPLIHNCPRYAGAGYYYQGNDAVEGANQLERAIETHHTNPKSKLIKGILQRFSPVTNAPTYKQLILNILK